MVEKYTNFTKLNIIKSINDQLAFDDKKVNIKIAQKID
jgi:hypothetical protein